MDDNIRTSFVLPCIKGLHKFLLSLSVTYRTGMVPSLLNALNENMAKYKSQDMFIFAAILDPRFKLKWCTDQVESKK